MDHAFPRFQILSLDGGGIKGLFSAAVLTAIEDDLNINIVDHFDLLTGTSTGGIIAIALGAGMRPREIVEFYMSKGPKIFSNRLGWRWFRNWFWSKFSQEPLKESLEDCFRDSLFGKSTKRLVIPTYNIGEDDVYLFRTPHAKRLKRDWKVPMWKVALATSSAPTYFPCSKHVDNLRLVDGGVWANNPTMVGIVEAIGTLGVSLEAIRAFSIGTSDAVSHRSSLLNNGGKIAWAWDTDAVDIIMRGQSIGVNNQATFLLGADRIERWNPKVSAKELSLDGVHKVKDLIGKARHVSRIMMPTFEAKFRDHQAAEYKPLYPEQPAKDAAPCPLSPQPI